MLTYYCNRADSLQYAMFCESNHTSYAFVTLGKQMSLANKDIVVNGIGGYNDELMQERRASIANAMELRFSCINPSIRWHLRCTVGYDETCNLWLT